MINDNVSLRSVFYLTRLEILQQQADSWLWQGAEQAEHLYSGMKLGCPSEELLWALSGFCGWGLLRAKHCYPVSISQALAVFTALRNEAVPQVFYSHTQNAILLLDVNSTPQYPFIMPSNSEVLNSKNFPGRSHLFSDHLMLCLAPVAGITSVLA